MKKQKKNNKCYAFGYPDGDLMETQVFAQLSEVLEEAKEKALDLDEEIIVYQLIPLKRVRRNQGTIVEDIK